LAVLYCSISSLSACHLPLLRSVLLLSLFYYCHPPPPDLPSFPTRRSSDLSTPGALSSAAADPATSLPPSSSEGAICSLMLRPREDRKSTRLNSSHVKISYAVFCLKKKKHK